MLGPQDVGFRVVIRRIAGSRDGRPLFTDILGELVSFTDGALTVAGKNGHEVIPIAAVVAGKRIPPRRDVSGGPGGAASSSPSS